MDRALVDALRADLARAGYTVDRLRELWGGVADAALARSDRVPARRALAARDDPAALLARLLILGDPLADAEATRALPGLGLDGAVALGLVERSGGEVRGRLDVRPYSVVDGQGVAEWWIASDPGDLVLGGALPEDHVLGAGGASATLAGLQLPDPVATALDLGTGCGIQSLHAARYADRVIATDVSARALRLAALTAALSGADAIEFRRGSLLEPLGDERVERIVSNPPFVITPRRPGVPRYQYRDAGFAGDGLLPRLIAALPEHLVPGGIAQLLGNWEYRGAGQERDGLAAVAEWADRAGLEHWIVERERIDPAAYAETWTRDGGTRAGTEDSERMIEAWLDDFADRDVEAVGFGYLLLRVPDPRAAHPPLRRTERLPDRLGGEPASLGAHLSAVLAARDRVAALDDAALAAASFVVASDVTEERSHWPGAEHPSAIVLRQGGGFGRGIVADPALAAVVGACDGELPVGVIVAAVAELLDVDPIALRSEVLPRIRELVTAGVVVPQI